MQPDPGITVFRSESAFRSTLKAELGHLQGKLADIRESWLARARPPEIPALPLPFGSRLAPPVPSVEAPIIDWERVEVLSLDIFDTCIRRVCGLPRNVFRMLDRRMELSGAPVESFPVIREAEENRVRRHFHELGGREDLSLEDIYQALRDRLAWTPEQAERWMAEEADLERSIVVPNNSILSLAREAASRGIPVVYTTEMYLPVPVLEDLLRKAGYPLGEGRVFASGETGLSKGTGGLYKRMMEGFPGKRIIHLGDNPESDVLSPSRLGIQAYLVPRIPPEYDDSLSNCLSEITRGADRDRPFWERLGYGTVGPLTAAWVRSIILEARDRDLRQLCFLTRDGYFPHKVFSRIRHQYALPLEGMTCFSSRRMLGLASMETITAQDWDFLLKPAPGLQVKDFFTRVDLGPEIYRPVCERAGLDPETAICHHRGFHDPSMKDRLYGMFLEVMDAFYVVRDGIRERMKAYLRSLGLEPGKFAIVDIGWNGSSLESLQRLLGSESIGRGFYLGLWKSRQGEATFKEQATSYFIQGEQATGEERLLRGGVGLFEFLLGSPLESVVDLRKDGNIWQPVYLRPGVVGSYEHQAYRQIEAGFDRFMERFMETNGFLLDGTGKAFLNDSLERLVYRPEDEEISKLGRVTHTEGWGTSKPMRLLPRMSPLKRPELRNLAYCYSGWKAAWRNLEYA